MDQKIRKLERQYEEDKLPVTYEKIREAYAKVGQLETFIQKYPIDFRTLLVRKPRPLRDHQDPYPLNGHISFGNQYLKLSIQCHAGSYCEPRESYLDFKKYTLWEIATLLPTGLCPPPDGTPYADQWESGMESVVCGYIETAKVQEIFNYFRLTYGEPKSNGTM